MANRLRNLAASALGVDRDAPPQPSPRRSARPTAAPLSPPPDGAPLQPADRLMSSAANAPVTVLSPSPPPSAPVALPVLAAPRVETAVTDARAVAVMLGGFLLALLLMALMVHH
jgi:hypothetical protein